MSAVMSHLHLISRQSQQMRCQFFWVSFSGTSFVILCSLGQNAASDICVISVSPLFGLLLCIPMWHAYINQKVHLAFLKFVHSSFLSFLCLPHHFLISQHLVASQLWCILRIQKHSTVLHCVSVFLFKSALNTFSDSKSPYIRPLTELPNGGAHFICNHPGFTTMNHNHCFSKIKSPHFIIVVLVRSYHTFLKAPVYSLNSSLITLFFTSQWPSIQYQYSLLLYHRVIEIPHILYTM